MEDEVVQLQMSVQDARLIANWFEDRVRRCDSMEYATLMEEEKRVARRLYEGLGIDIPDHIERRL